jgi:hypothetical protein
VSRYYVVLDLPNHTTDEKPEDDRSSVALYVEHRLGDGADATVYSSLGDLSADARPKRTLPRCYKCGQAIRASEYLDDDTPGGTRHIVCPAPRS